MLAQYRKALVIIGLVSLVGLLPSASAFAMAQKLSPAQCARMKSKSECESCMRKACGNTSCGSKAPAGNKSINWGSACGAGI